MDDYIFNTSVKGSLCVEEATHYLEIFNYSDQAHNYCEHHPLTKDEFYNFLHRRGAFEPPKLPDGVVLRDGMRLIIQKNAKHSETFSPYYISLTHDEYSAMVRTLRLPTRGIETGSLVGPFFWCGHDEDVDDRHLQILFRKSDVRKKGKTRGWELMLSYSFNTGLTTGYVKGTESSDINDSLKTLQACSQEVGHPMLLPMIILAHDMSYKSDIRQREARDWLRKLENAITMRNEVEERDQYKNFDVDGINRDLVECHSQVLWKRPQAYKGIIKDFETGMDDFMKFLSQDKRVRKIEAQDGSMRSRLAFYRNKLTGMEHYIHTTLERLHIQRQALYNIMAQKESKLNLEMAGQQRRLAHASKRDSTAMKTLSLLGAVFLPGTFLSSVFSMTFFDFEVPPGEEVSVDLWIYFIITIPLTLAIVLSWWYLDLRREKRYALEDQDIEKGIEKMETDILAIMRKKTMSKASTWNSNPGISVFSSKKEPAKKE